MIAFLNFAPINFGGGAERWILDVASEVNKQESVTLIDVHSSLSNYYGKLVLKRAFDKRIEVNTGRHLSMKIDSFIPFTKKWKEIRNIFQEVRIIYIRFEVLETLIIIYFGGFTIFKKTIAGIHSPFIYVNPIMLFDHLHNFIYRSFLSKFFLARMKKIHVLNPRDEKFFKHTFNLSNVIRVPNYIEMSRENDKAINLSKNQLNIAFVGELNDRKGADILLKVINESPDNYIFHIAGDGIYKGKITLLKNKNVKYYGYLSKEKLDKLYCKCDLLFQPSRAESFSLVALEAMANGLILINSSATELDLPKFVQKTVEKNVFNSYIALFKNIYTRKKNMTGIVRTNIRKYIKQNFSREVVIPLLITKLF